VKLGSKGGKRADLANRYFRSMWEANYARYLNWLLQKALIKSWEYEPDEFEFAGIKRGTRFYLPDFKVTELGGSVIYHEVKGFMDSKSATALKRMAKYFPGVKIIVIGKKSYAAISRDVRAFIPTWESA
jgi:hypothetical protein